MPRDTNNRRRHRSTPYERPTLEDLHRQLEDALERRYQTRRRQRQNRLRSIQIKQQRMMAELKKEPVINFKFECSVCFETYSQQSNDTCPFLIPTTCDHGFCFKCVIDLQSNAMNIPHSIVCCPLCNTQVKMWRSLKPNAVVTCKFYKKTQERVPAVQQYKNIIKVLQERSVISVENNDKNCDINMENQAKIVALEAELKNEKNHSNQAASENRQLIEENTRLNEQVQELQRQVRTLAPQRGITVNPQIGRDDRAPAELNERFRSLVYSTISELFIENRVHSIQNYVYAGTSGAASSCDVNVTVNFGFEN
nr:pe38 [Bombyx mori nucleopolyhedrovirus]WRK24079.1 pe38 [Bombyx mori nucleopolyhedrovirus]